MIELARETSIATGNTPSLYTTGAESTWQRVVVPRSEREIDSGSRGKEERRKQKTVQPRTLGRSFKKLRKTSCVPFVFWCASAKNHAEYHARKTIVFAEIITKKIRVKSGHGKDPDESALSCFFLHDNRIQRVVVVVLSVVVVVIVCVAYVYSFSAGNSYGLRRVENVRWSCHSRVCLRISSVYLLSGLVVRNNRFSYRFRVVIIPVDVLWTTSSATSSSSCVLLGCKFFKPRGRDVSRHN